ncbi:MAG: HupE/UreJ family protein [Alphaproteobacteria bacterium]|nr:HupE/UreJ family protein [Alphaproteobacteria bacterium]
MLARHWVIAIVLAGCLILLAVPAQAHTSEGVAGGFLSGFLHPILGYDHLVAMVAVGLWGAFLGTPAIWLLPIVFPTVMAIGGAIGILGIPMPAVDLLVAGSAVVLGACIALALRAPIWIAALLVGAFAIFHGHAHGSELPQAADPLAYAFGFVIATGLLHVSGIGLGLLSRYRAGEYGVRGLGVAIAVVGLTFLTGSV